MYQRLSILSVVIGIASVSILTGCDPQTTRPNELFQVSTLHALKHRKLDPVISYQTLRKKGDFGIGTFTGLDGEMVAVDGTFFQVKGDGRVVEANPSADAPFASVTRFNPSQSVKVTSFQNYAQLKKVIDTYRKHPHRVYAIKITGTFNSMTTRSVHKQKKPYPDLSVVIREQSVFKFKDVEATLVGFYGPSDFAGVLFDGYHFHALTNDRQAGGHVLDFIIRSGTIELAEIKRATIQMP